MVLRNALLRLSGQKQLRHWMETSPAASRLTSRFIAGETLEDAVKVCRTLNEDGFLVSLDHLGENVTTVEEAAAATEAAVQAVERIASEQLQSTISVKLTQLGLDLSEQICRQNLVRLMKTASRFRITVEIDMESSEYTDRTLACVREMHGEFGFVRAVIQAYLYRSEEDIRVLSEQGVPVRLCKGAYKEPESLAFSEKAQVDRNYQKLTRLLLERGTYPAIATHDSAMIDTALAAARELGLPADRFEFQMLYGIRRDLQQSLRSKGYRVRLYVPYGDAWYPYFMRRLAERPANLLFLARNLFRR
ncbi:MAG: proline dehydrogenase family protein [Bryobacteraceae bacterium]|nr:proline dehydrogenase family protein [Bryobacteraceae bacterium]